MMSVKQFSSKQPTGNSWKYLDILVHIPYGSGGLPGGAAVEDLHLHGACHLWSAPDPPRNPVDPFK